MHRADSAPAQLFEAWERTQGRRDRTVDEFLDALRPKQMTVTADGGGRATLDRVVMSYLATADEPGDEDDNPTAKEGT